MTGPPNEMLDFMRHSELPKALPKTFLWLTVRAAMNISILKQLVCATCGVCSRGCVGPNNPILCGPQAQWNSHDHRRLTRQEQLLNYLCFPLPPISFNERTNLCLRQNIWKGRNDGSTNFLRQPFIFLHLHRITITNSSNHTFPDNISRTNDTFPSI